MNLKFKLYRVYFNTKSDESINILIAPANWPVWTKC